MADLDSADRVTGAAVDHDDVALSSSHYRTSDDDMAAMSPAARRILMAYRERSGFYAARARTQAAAVLAAEVREAARLNRESALRQVDGLYATQCACGWHGLRVADPEVARREHDAHVCAITGDAHVDRAMSGSHILVKRVGTEVAVDSAVQRDDVAVAAPVTTDDTEQRMNLLELK